MFEVYHIEFLGPEAQGGRVLRRVLIHARSAAAAQERALTAFRRARRPQSRGDEVEAVRLMDGAGYEVFSVTARD